MTWATTKFYVLAACLLLAFGLGLGLGWKLYHPKTPPLVPAAPAVILPDHGGTMIERKAQDTTAKPKTGVPPGATVEHTGSVTITPPPSALPSSSPSANTAQAVVVPPCPSLTIDWSLVRLADGNERMIFKGPDGATITGVDIPVHPAGPPAPPPKWAAYASYYLRERTYGITALRASGPFVLGATVKQARAEFGSGKLSADVAISAGLHW